MASYRELAGALEAVVRAIRHGNIPSGSTLLTRCESLIAEACRGILTEIGWTPFVKADAGSVSEATLRAAAVRSGWSLAEVRAMVAAEVAGAEIWINSRYQVMRCRLDDVTIHLSIKRIDQQPVRSWRDLQRIKNELVGPENEAVEVFPAESRLVDTANQYHLFVCTDPTRRIPFGFDAGRHVFTESVGSAGQAPEEPQ